MEKIYKMRKFSLSKRTIGKRAALFRCSNKNCNASISLKTEVKPDIVEPQIIVPIQVTNMNLMQFQFLSSRF